MATKSYERELGELHTKIQNIEAKVDDIHHILIGNGKPGLIMEFNQWKGSVKMVTWIIGSLSTAAMVVAWLR